MYVNDFLTNILIDNDILTHFFYPLLTHHSHHP